MAQGAELFSQTYNTLASVEASQRTHNLNVQKEQTSQLQKALDDIMTNLEGGVSNAAKMATDLIEKGAEPSAIMASLEAIAQDAGSPVVSQAINAIKLSMPMTADEYSIRKTKRDIKASQPVIDELVRSGVPKD